MLRWRFVVDRESGASVADCLMGEGHEGLAVAEIAHQIADSDILDGALREERIIVTNDKDFGDLVFRSGHAHHGILLLRLQDESPSGKVAVVAAILKQYAARLPGNFVVASETKVRIRNHQA